MINFKTGLIFSLGIILSANIFAAGPGIHPLDGLKADEYKQITSILQKAGKATKDSLYPLIELKEPHKDLVKAWDKGKAVDRKALAHIKNKDGYLRAIINLTTKKVEESSKLDAETMVLFAEFINAMDIALKDERFIKALAKRDVKPEQAFCLPLTAGNFFSEEEKGKRIMKIPCYLSPTSSNFYAKPIEGLYAVIDLKAGKMLKIIDEEVLPIPKDGWGYTEEEVAKRVPIRKNANPTKLVQTGKPNFTITDSEIVWDMWKFRFRTDKRPGMVISDVKVNDGKNWRDLIYQTHLSEVFVPYMDPSEGWYWRTYMDSGEYGFGLFLTPLRKGVDCPAYAEFLPATIHDDSGNPLVIPDAICVFERSIGDPAWRHFEVFAQTPEQPVPTEGRVGSELVVRSASQVGNYDYLVDYRFKQNGDFYIKIGATGLDAVKGVASTSLGDATAAEDTKYGTLIAPNLVAANHDHYFNFKIDMDIDGTENMAMRADLVPHTPGGDIPRRSMWKVDKKPIKTEMEGRMKFSSSAPSYFHIMNMSKKGNLGHTPSYMLHHTNVAYGPFDFKNDPPMKRNAYIEYTVWNTLYNPDRRYAGGEYAFASDGSDTLAEWAKEDKDIMNKDIVTWVSSGFHHVPRMEDWPVMTTEWKTIHLMPMNFFSHNPALTLQGPKD